MQKLLLIKLSYHNRHTDQNIFKQASHFTGRKSTERKQEFKHLQNHAKQLTQMHVF